MRSRTTSRSGGTSGGRLFATLFFGFFLFAGAALLWLFASTIVFPYFWDRVECEVLSCEILQRSTSTGSTSRYRTHIEYAYSINGQRYEEDTMQGFSNFREANELAERFPAGGIGHCYVNPLNHSSSVVKREPLWMASISVMPAVFLLIGGYGLYWIWFRQPAKGRSYGMKHDRPKPVSKQASSKAVPAFLMAFFSFFLICGLALFGFLFVGPVLKLIAANHWQETPCTILSSRVLAHDGDPGVTYSVDILYSYKFAGHQYQSSEYSFIGATSGHRRGKEAIVKQYPPGSEAVCYVNPSDPARAILNRSFSLVLLFGLLPLIFVGIGACGVLYGWRRYKGIKDAGAPK